MNNLIRLKSVISMTGLSKSSIYALMQTGEFPQNIQISKRGVAWLDTEIRIWIDTKISISRGE